MAGALKTKLQTIKREKLIKAGQLKETGDGAVMEKVYNKKLKFPNNKVKSRSKAINDKVAASQNIDSNKIVEEKRKINFNNKHIPNPLHDFNNFSPIITLIAMTKEEVNFPNVLLEKGDYGKFVIAQTAGKTGNRANTSTFIDRSVKGNLEFLIDNLDIDSIVAPSKRKNTLRQQTFVLKSQNLTVLDFLLPQ